MKMTAEQENGRNYLKCVLESGAELDEDCLATISDEQASEGSKVITGIIPVIYSQVFEERILRYDVNAFMSLQEYKGYISTKEQISVLFLSIIDICRQADAFLLDITYFLLEEQYIYVDKESGKAHLILYPVFGQNRQGDFRELFSQMMQGIHLSMEDMNFYGAVVYELNQADSFSIVRFRELLVNASGGQGIPGKSGQRKEMEQSREQQGKAYENVQGNAWEAGKPGVGADATLGVAPWNYASGEVFRSEPQSVCGQAEQMSAAVSAKITGAKKSEENAGEKGEKKKGLFDKMFAGNAGKKNKEPKAVKEKPVKEKAVKEKAVKVKKAKASGSSFLELPDEEVKSNPASAPMQEPGKKPEPPRAVESPAQLRGTAYRASIPMTDDEDVMEYGSTEDEIGQTPYLVLHYLNENRYITVNTFPFEIGREGRGLRIDASKTKVSRKHAEIISAPDGFKICDLSKLGTFLDGVRIPQGSYVALRNGMKLSLKDEEFVVSIYEG